MMLPPIQVVLFFLSCADLARPVDLGQAPYPVDHAAALATTQMVVAQTTDYTQLRVEFNGAGGQRVPAFLYLPKDQQQSHPAILLQYGSGGNKTTNYIVAIARHAVARGFVVLTIDIPGKGERRGRGQSSLVAEIRDLRARLTQTLGDYSRAVDYLAERAEVDRQRLGFVGISWGAITGIPFVAHDQRIKAMVSVLGGGGFLAFLPDRLGGDLDPIYHLPALAPRPVLLLNAYRDQIIPRFFSEALHSAAGQGARKEWVNTDHLFNGVDRLEAARRVVDFMAHAL